MIGAGRINTLMFSPPNSLIDEIIFTIIPQTLGEGIPLGLTFESFEFISEKALTNGMIQKIYSRKE